MSPAPAKFLSFLLVCGVCVCILPSSLEREKGAGFIIPMARMVERRRRGRESKHLAATQRISLHPIPPAVSLNFPFIINKKPEKKKNEERFFFFRSTDKFFSIVTPGAPDLTIFTPACGLISYYSTARKFKQFGHPGGSPPRQKKKRTGRHLIPIPFNSVPSFSTLSHLLSMR